MAWLFFLGGPLIWAVHLTAIYAVASIADITGHSGSLWPRIAIILMTLTGIVACAWLIVRAVARAGSGPGATDGLTRFWNRTAGLSALVSLVAIVWQGLPALW